MMRGCFSQPALAAALALAGAAEAPAQNLTNTGTQLTVQAGVTLHVGGSLSNQAGATLTTGGTVRVGGDFTNAGTVVPAGGTVVFVGSTDQMLTPGGAALANVEVRNTGPAGQNRVLLPTDLTVSQQLTLTSGMLRTAPTATLLLPNGATLSGEASGRYAQGNVRVERTGVTGGASVDFGNGVVLNPAGNSLGTVRVTRSAGLQQAGVTFGQNPAQPSQHGIDRIWSITAEQPPTAPFDLTLTWLPDNDNGLTFGTGQVWRMPDNNAAWQPVGNAANAAGRSLTVGTASLARWTVSSPATPLPVELLRFTAERQGADALLRWATATEKNNARFEVESSPDGFTFSRVGTVAGHGTSSQPHEYTFTDPQLARYAAPVVYYRLRQLDYDGTATLSPVRTVQVPAASSLVVQAYPQPFAATLNVLIRTAEAGSASIGLLDAVGRRLFSRPVTLPAGSTAVALPEAAALPTGVYVLEVVQHQQRRTVKVVRE